MRCESDVNLKMIISSRNGANRYYEKIFNYCNSAQLLPVSVNFSVWAFTEPTLCSLCQDSLAEMRGVELTVGSETIVFE